MPEEFEILGTIEQVEAIAVGSRIREIARLRKAYGVGRWRKMKGIATVHFVDGTIQVERHWYEAHGIGRKKIKTTSTSLHGHTGIRNVIRFVCR